MNFDSIRFENKKIIFQNTTYQLKIHEIEKIEEFLDDFGYLSFDRNYVLCQKYTFSLQILITSLELTIGSIVECCSTGCLTDANTLLRKYRDDIFFYLYVYVYDSNKKLGLSLKENEKAEKNIIKWLQNDLSDLNIGAVLKTIAMSPNINEAIQKYNLHQYFDQLNKRLNNYVHGNGTKYYNKFIMNYKINEFQERLCSLVEDIRFITVTFLFLLTLCSPISIMSTDYIDYLENNATPPEGSQYWVAPFIVDFFKENKHLINDECLDYLRDNTPMII